MTAEGRSSSARVAGVAAPRPARERPTTFDRARLAESIRRAQAEAGDDDAGFSDEVAVIVEMGLQQRRSSTADAAAASGPLLADPDTVGELVERVLVELGRAPVARAYILSRARRAAAREALGAAQPRERGLGRLPDVRGAGGTTSWNRARIVAALVEEAGLARDRAEAVAERVEERVAGAQLRRLSTGLVRELVSNELLALGLDGALRAHEALGLPRYDLRRLFSEVRTRRPGAARDGEPGPGGLEERVSGEILRRYALDDLVGDEAAERHRAGDHHFLDLERPHRVLWRSLPAELLLRREPSPASTHELALDATTLASDAAEGLVLEDLAKAVGPALRQSRSDATLRDLLLALAIGAEGARRRIDLARPGGRGASLLGRLVRVLAGLHEEGLPSPRLFLTGSELGQLDPDGALADQVERLLAAGRLVPVWHGPDGVWVAPGCLRRSGDRVPLALGAAVALNLPRLARRAGPWREDVLLASLAGAVESGLDGLVDLDGHQREARAAHGEALRERVVHAVVPVGLFEALRILGDGVARAEQGARVLGLLVDATARFAHARGLHVRVTPLTSGAAAARFARLDASTSGVQQPRLFADLPQPEEELGASYSCGYALTELGAVGAPEGADPLTSAARADGAALADLLATVPAGALYPLESQGSPRSGATPLLDLWRGFDERRHAIAPGPRGVQPGTLF